MALSKWHIAHHAEILALPGFLKDPVLILGFQEIHNVGDERFRQPDLGTFLRARGFQEVATLDLFDERADLRWDMNEPLPAEHFERYGTLIDIGSIEHIFNIPQVLANCMKALAVGGHYFMHAPVNGYLFHGLYVFSPELIVEAFRVNGFEIVYLSYSARDGRPLRRPSEAADTIIWIVGRKTHRIESLVFPNQERWALEYGADEGQPKPFDNYGGLIRATEQRYLPLNFCQSWQPPVPKPRRWSELAVRTARDVCPPLLWRVLARLARSLQSKRATSNHPVVTHGPPR